MARTKEEIRKANEEALAAKAKARAESDPMLNPTVRPEAVQDDPAYVKYYSWIGGASSGRWKLYREPINSAKADQALVRSTGGATQGSFNSAVGANFVPTPTAGTGGVGGGGGAGGGGTGGGSGTSAGGAGTGGGTSAGGGGGKGGAVVTGATYTAPDGRIFTDINAYNAYIQETKNAEQKAARQSAYDLLFEQFNQYGLGGLVTPLRSLIESGVNPAEFTIKLRETDAYKKRFAANQARIQKGLRALSEAEYIGLEDQYQDVMRRYGLPQDYYARGEMGRQEGFEKFIGGDVSPVELEDRIQTAQRRVLNAAPQIKDALTQYYGNEISNGDILAYVLDPDKAIENIKRKVTAAEIGAGAAMAGLGATKARAEELGAFGVTGEQARQGFQAISSYLPRAQQLGDIYAKQGMGPFTQMTAEAEVFGTPGATDAAAKRRKLTELEQAQFGGSSGAFGGALARERAGQF